MPVRRPRRPKQAAFAPPTGRTFTAAIKGFNRAYAKSSRPTPRPTPRPTSRPSPQPSSYEETQRDPQGNRHDDYHSYFEQPYSFKAFDPASLGDRGRAEDLVFGEGGEGGGAGGGDEEEEPEPWHFPDVEPTATSNPERPRTEAAGYDPSTGSLYVRFRAGADRQEPSGAIYRYDVPPDVAQVYMNAALTPSPGRLINVLLNNFPYERSSLPE